MFFGSSLADIIIFLSVFFVFYLCMKTWSRKETAKRRYPPSLSLLSLIFNVLFKGIDSLADYFSKKSLEIGPIFAVSIGSRLCLILNNVEVIEEALLKQSRIYAGRERFYSERCFLNKNGKGILSRNFDDQYRKYHSMYLVILKEFGFGIRSLLEQRILVEVEEVIEQLRNKKGMPFNPEKLTMHMVSNVICGMIYGRRRALDQSISEYISLGLMMLDRMDPLLDFAPVLRFIPSRWRNLQFVIKSNEKWLGLLNEEVKKCQGPDAPPSFVSRVLDKEGPNNDPEQLIATLREFITAGVDTLMSTMLWSYVLFANNPVVQQRMQKEIDEVVPRDRLPSMDDKPQLPYVEATLTEILRFATTVPLGVPHVTLSDSEISGYFIPSGTLVLPNIHAAHMNPHDWSDPDKFRPDRFLDKENRHDNGRLIAFSVGRRACLGEMLARQELFLFISGLVQNFTIKPPDGKQSIDVGKYGMIVSKPSAFEVKMMPRTSHP